MRVEFSELALAGLRKLIPDPSSQRSAYASLKWYLARRGAEDSRRCHAFSDRELLVFPFGQFRVLYEARDNYFVWSFTLLTEYDRARLN